MTTPTLPPYEEDASLNPVSAYPEINFKDPTDPLTHLETAIWGLGVRHVTPEAKFNINAWVGRGLNDYYAVRIKDLDNPAASDLVTDLKPPYYSLKVERENMPEGEVQILSRVVRAVSRNETRSPPQTILIKTTLPGGIDRRVWEPWHSNLVMSIEGLKENAVITRAIATKGVVCLITKYLNIRKNDVITVVVDGVSVKYVVSPTDAAGPGPIRVPIKPDILAKISPSGTIGIIFKVRDVVHNISGGKYPFSKPYMLRSELDPTLLRQPLFMVNGKVTRQVDLDTQSRAAFTAKVFLDYEEPEPIFNNWVAVILEMTSADGSTQTVRLPDQTDWNIGGEVVKIPNDYITQLAGGWFRLSYEWLGPTGQLLGSSYSFTVQVVGTPVVMPHVTVIPNEAGLIPIGVDAIVSMPDYQPYNDGWLETLICQLLPPSTAAPYREAQPAGPQGGTRRLSKEVLSAFAGKGPFEIYYITNDGLGNPTSIRESARLVVRVEDRVGTLPAPLLDRSVGTNIDPANVLDDKYVLAMFPYDGALIDDMLEWSITGKGPAGAAGGSIRISGAYAGDNLPPVRFPIPRSVLDNNIDATITFSYSITRPGTPPQVLQSKVLNLTVGQLVTLQPPKVIQAGALQQQVDPKDVFKGATVRIAYTPMRATDQIFVKWLGTYGISDIELEVFGNSQDYYVEVVVPPEVIAKGVRPEGNRITVQYRFARGQFTHKSEVLTLQLLPLVGLASPTIEGIGDDSLLRLALLTDTAHTLIPNWPLIHQDQLMWLTLEGTLKDGTPFVEDTYTAELVTANGITNGVKPPAPVSKLKGLKDGSKLSIHFWVSFAQSTDKSTAVEFPVRDYIVQAADSKLAAPKFDNINGDSISIYPLKYVTSASVRVDYLNMKTSDSIAPQLIFPDGSIESLPAKPGATIGYVNFPISQELLRRSVGKTITLRYVATIAGVPLNSAKQTLIVETIKATDLPQPLINSLADASTLDLNTFLGNGLLTLQKWPLMAVGQRIWIRCSGDYVQDLLVRDSLEITDAHLTSGLVNIPVTRSWLSALKSSKFTVTCRVTFDGGYDETKAIEFKSTTYNLRWPLGILQNIQVGASPHFIAMTRDGSTAYLTNTWSHSISVIDILQRKVVATIGGFNAPYHIVMHPDQPRLYVMNLGTNTISIVDRITGNILKTLEGFNFALTSTAISRPGLAINAEGTKLFVASQGNSTIYVHDTQSGALLSTMSVPGAAGLSGVAFNPAQTKLYAGSSDRLNLLTGTGTGGVTGYIAGFNNVFNMVFNPNDLPYPRAYVTGSDNLVIVNSATDQVHKRIPFAYSFAAAINPKVPECYVGTNATTLSVINTASETTVRNLPGFSHPAGIAVVPDGFIALVANNANGTLSFVAV